MAQPATADEVSAVIKYAKSNNLAFNVKGGGHSTSQVSSSPSADGMVLDLSLMRRTSVDTTQQTISFQGGCTWDDVNEALWAHGLATTGGTVSHTGVGGLILHGGFGILAGLHGLAIDALVSCQVVLADGSIVTASEQENPDLFWGLRGAGSSFGVVTEFTSKAFPQGNIWGGKMFISLDNLPQVVDFVNRWGQTTDGTQPFIVGFTHLPCPPDGGSDAQRPPTILMQMADIGQDPENSGPKFYKPILEMDSFVKHVGMMPYPVINTGNDEEFGNGSRYLLGGSNFTLPLKLSTAEALRDNFYGFIDKHPDATGSMCLFECVPNKKIRSVPMESTAFSSRGNYYNIAHVWKWEDAGLDVTMREFNRGLQRDIRKLGYHDEDQKDGVGEYINYTTFEPITAEKAFGSNAQRLQKLKQKYDPCNVFDKLWKLVPKVQDQWAA